MKLLNRLLLPLFATVALVISGCSKSAEQEQIADDAAKQIDKMADAVASIKDKTTAEKAVATFKEIAEDLKKLSARAKAAGKPSPELRAKIEAKMTAKTEEMKVKMQGAMANLMKAGPEAMAIFQKGMAELGPTMEEVGKSFGE